MLQKILSALLLVCLSVGMAGCFGSKGQPISELVQSKETEPYSIAAGDSLSVTVWGEPRLSGEVLVRDDGRLTLPLVNDVDVEGMTLEDASAKLEEKLAEFIPGASVSISVLASAPTRYYLSGAFLKPGEYRNDARITLLQAIATGGGFAPFADESEITLIRRKEGKEVRYFLDYSKVVAGSEPNPLLKTGDIIAVK